MLEHLLYNKTVRQVKGLEMRKTMLKVNPNLVKSRDLVHLQEITHPAGVGAHKSKKDKLQQVERKARQKGEWD